jgi:FMN-binding domain
MRRIALWIASTVVVLVLLFSYHTSTSGPGAARGAAAGGNRPGIVSGPAPSGAPAPAPGGPTAPAGQGTVVNGSVAQTRWGPVQVQVTISGGRITSVVVLQQPDGNFRDREINSSAIPQLNQEVLAAQSANIDAVSGATVTSDGYVESLQAALDAAHFSG